MSANLARTSFIVIAITISALAIAGAIIAVTANSFAVLDRVGPTALAVAPFIGLGSVLTAWQLRRNRCDRNPRLVAIGTITAVLGSIVFGTSIVVAALNGPNSGNRPSNASAGQIGGQAASVVPASSTSIAPPSGVPLPSGTPCPFPDPTDPTLPSIEVKVIYWCTSEVINKDGSTDTTNFQIKLRPRLVNNTPFPISISIHNQSSIRLLVTGKQIDKRWSPPPLTKAAGDHPILYKCNGGTFWAIPPNVPHDASLINDKTLYTGFATSWDGEELDPGQSYYKPLRKQSNGLPIQEGNLVFQVPVDEAGQATIYGLAVIDPTRDNVVLGLALFGNKDQWGQKVEPTEF